MACSNWWCMSWASCRVKTSGFSALVGRVWCNSSSRPSTFNLHLFLQRLVANVERVGLGSWPGVWPCVFSSYTDSLRCFSKSVVSVLLDMVSGWFSGSIWKVFCEFEDYLIIDKSRQPQYSESKVVKRNKQQICYFMLLSFVGRLLTLLSNVWCPDGHPQPKNWTDHIWRKTLE